MRTIMAPQQRRQHTADTEKPELMQGKCCLGVRYQLFGNELVRIWVKKKEVC